MRYLPLAILLLLANPAQAQLAPMNDEGMTYGQVHLNVSDVDLHARLWVEHFHGEVIERGPLTAIRIPNFMIFLEPRAPEAGSQGSVVDHFGFKVRSREEVVSKWRAAGLEVQREFTGAEGFPNAYLMGPDSVRIELQEDTTLDRAVIGHHIHFNTPDYVALMAWYVDTFGVEPFQRGTIVTTANAPGVNLSFADAPEVTAPTRRRAIDHIGFEYADLDAVYERLRARGIVFDGPPREIPGTGVRAVTFVDPWGVTLELTEGLVDF